MIKKISSFSLIGLFFIGTAVYAGDMGGMDDGGNNFFLAVEGSYTKNTINNFAFILLGTDSAVFSAKTDQLYGVRFSGGFMDRICDEFAASGEIGWGYYGRTTLNPVGTGIFVGVPGSLTISNTINGFDALLGVYYTQSCFNLFLKGGALIANNITTVDALFNPLTFAFTNTFHFSTSGTQALPEVKLGGSYFITDNWAITAAYMHAFGNTVQTVGTFDPVTFNATFSANVKSPSLNSVLVGIQFSI